MRALSAPATAAIVGAWRRGEALAGSACLRGARKGGGPQLHPRGTRGRARRGGARAAEKPARVQRARGRPAPQLGRDDRAGGSREHGRGRVQPRRRARRRAAGMPAARARRRAGASGCSRTTSRVIARSSSRARAAAAARRRRPPRAARRRRRLPTCCSAQARPAARRVGGGGASARPARAGAPRPRGSAAAAPDSRRRRARARGRGLGHRLGRGASVAAAALGSHKPRCRIGSCRLRRRAVVSAAATATALSLVTTASREERLFLARHLDRLTTRPGTNRILRSSTPTVLGAGLMSTFVPAMGPSARARRARTRRRRARRLPVTTKRAATAEREPRRRSPRPPAAGTAVRRRLRTGGQGAQPRESRALCPLIAFARARARKRDLRNLCSLSRLSARPGAPSRWRCSRPPRSWSLTELSSAARDALSAVVRTLEAGLGCDRDCGCGSAPAADPSARAAGRQRQADARRRLARPE